MKKISVKNVVRFRNKKDQTRLTLLNNLTKQEELTTPTDGGGDYWVTSLSALSNAVKAKNTTPIKNKIIDISTKIQPGLIKQTKDMYERNLSILHYYENFNINNWLPTNAKILTKITKRVIIEIEQVPVQIEPSQVFYVEEDGTKRAGAIWFVAQLTGFSNPDLGMFAECLYIHLDKILDDQYEIEPKYCLVVEAVKNTAVNYQMILDEEVPSLLSSTLAEIRKINGTL